MLIQDSQAKEKKKRKTHSNKGKVYMTERDRQCLSWIIEQDEVFAPQLQLLLVRHSGYADKTTEPTLSWSRTRTMITRWEEKGRWVKYRHVYRKATEPYKSPSVYATREAMRELGYNFDPIPPHETHNREHRFAVNWVRLYLEMWLTQQQFEWSIKGERQLRHENPAWGSWPDFELTYGRPSTGNPFVDVAVQVEKSSKTDAEYAELIEKYSGRNPSFPRGRDYGQIWYFPSSKIEARVTRIFEPVKDRFLVIPLRGKTLEDGSAFPY